MPKTQEETYRSEISAAMHGMVKGFHRAGLVDKPTMREFDANCLAPAPILSLDETKAIREQEAVSE
ncbi:hypothetical protein ACQKJ1_25010 [Methylorubrum rhodesianum]|uniref:hypothetical protein n=1 Tax=Methylorubrum rhodesianum TaxID=29427 RepID=UPI003D0819E8